MGAIRNFRSDAIQTMIKCIDHNAFKKDGSESGWDNFQDWIMEQYGLFSNTNTLQEDMSNLDGFTAYIMETDDITEERLKVILDGVKDVEDSTNKEISKNNRRFSSIKEQAKRF